MKTKLLGRESHRVVRGNVVRKERGDRKVAVAAERVTRFRSTLLPRWGASVPVNLEVES